MSNIVTYEARFNEKDFTRGAQNIFTQVNQINQAVNQTNTFIGSLGNAFGNAVVKFKNLTDVVNNMNDAISSIAAPGLEAGTQLRNMTTLFRGNAEEAQDMYDRIAEYGKDVKIYDKGTLLEAQKTMMSFGVDAEKSFGALKNIGDIAMGDGQKMQSLSLAFACVDARYAVACDVQETTHFSYLGSFVLKEKLLKTSKKGGRQTASGKRLSLQKKRKHG